MNRVGREFKLPMVTLAGAIAAILAQQARAQDETQQAQAQNQAPEGVIEEVVAVGRFLSSSQQVANERMTDAAVVDTMGSELISRLGDSTVAASLRRLPGLSVVQDKFVYIRGLGERYSATSLNGAQIPSPDLTRNVIPLDVFPTSVVESLRVQKAWSPDLSANFAGGAVDIRTRGIPDQFEMSLELSIGSSDENDGSGLTYPGGSDDNLGTDDGSRDLSPAILEAVNRYQGAVDVQSILAFERRADPTFTLADAQSINRSLGVALNRDIGVQEKSFSPDGGIRFNIGSRFDLSREIDLGVMFSTDYDTQWRKTTGISRNFSFPDERTETERETTRSVDISSTLNVGLNFTDDHSFRFTSLALRNTDDETAVIDFFNENREIPDGLGFRDYRLQFEERNMRTNQIEGTHFIGDSTRERIGFLSSWEWLPVETRVDWFYSESDAKTNIPNQVRVSSFTTTDPVTAEVLNEQVALQSTAADYRFTDLDDEVDSWGWSITLPFETNNSLIELKGGTGHSEKARKYYQAQFSLGALGVADPATLRGSLDSVFSDENLMDTANNYVFARQGTNNQSYLAATMTESAFGMVDWTLNDTWRINAGARWEDYRQVAVDWNPFGYSQTNPQVTTDPDVLELGSFSEDEIYPALSFTYMSNFWAETFQLRLGASQTAIRPDLREITDASYIDPITGDLVDGNPGVVPSDVDNLDLRAEWFFSNGDNFTVTLFQKQIANPIEFFESAASDTTVAREIINAESAEVRGIEIEGLKELAAWGGFFDTLFVQGNVTVQDSELVAGSQADAPTNPIRALSGASDYIANFMIGYDSRNAKHTASLIYNVFGERLYVGGRNGAPDGFEQPFRSLDFTYSWYPSDTLTFKAKMQNLLGERIEIQREDVVTFFEDPGTTISLGLQWRL
jgi:TonB-dependent receptor